MIRVIRPKASYLNKSSSILNQLNIKGRNLKKKFNCTNGFKTKKNRK